MGHQGSVVRTSSWGSRDLAGQPGDSLFDIDLPFTTTTQNGVASTTKTVTAVAVARALEEKGLSLDTKVAPYLPAPWTKHPSMLTVTFRQLLHHDGLKHPGSICDTDPYECLKDAVALGMTASPGYNNIHYTVMRVILPFLSDPTGMTTLFETETDGAKLNEAFSQSFRTYVRDVLHDGGVNSDFAYTSDNVALHYSFGPPPSGDWIEADNDSQAYLFAGSGGLKATAPQLARFLTEFDAGNVVSPAMVKALKDGNLGFDNQNGWTSPTTPALGPLHSKNGGAAGLSSQLVILPSGVQAFLTATGLGPLPAAAGGSS
ncbi:MAG: serine hydrolase domain-containing protein, partial [Acidimicrobiales bacterium]